MARYLEYSVKIPYGGMVDAAVVRGRLAAQHEKTPEYAFDPAIFHYNKDKHPSKGVSPFRFAGGKNFRIYAVGDDAVRLLNAEAHKITRLLELAYGTDLLEERRVGMFDAGIDRSLKTFYVRSLVLQQDPAHHKKLMAMEAGAREAWIDSLIRRGLAKQLRKLEIPFEIDDPMLVMGDIKVNGGYSSVEVKPGIFFMAANKVTFRANLRLEGPFHVGHLISRGHGAILKNRNRD